MYLFVVTALLLNLVFINSSVRALNSELNTNLNTIKLKMGVNNMYHNGRAIKLNVEPIIYNNMTYVSISDFYNFFEDGWIEWDEKQKTINTWWYE